MPVLVVACVRTPAVPASDRGRTTASVSDGDVAASALNPAVDNREAGLPAQRPTSHYRVEGREPDGGWRGRLDPALIQSAVRGRYDAFRQCYEDGLRVDANLRGRVVVRFVIERDGSVGAISDDGSDLPNEKVKQCVAMEYRAIRFPEPQGGIVTVVYPIMFSPEDDGDRDAGARRD